MDVQHTARLNEVQLLALRETLQHTEKLKHFVEDYASLRRLLEKLPQKISYDVMVPLGSLAFMPGKLVHTNEILVLLGENWFTLKSAKESDDLAGRRIADLKEQIVGSEQQKHILSSKIEFTNELFDTCKNEDVCEIVEAFDEEKEKTWREQHQRNVQKYHSELSKMKSSHQGNSQHDAEFQQLWQRLEELEEKDETLELSCDNERQSTESVCGSLATSHSTVGTKPKIIKKSVKWPDQQESPDESSDDCGDGRDVRTTATSGTMFHQNAPIIAFHHTSSSSKAELNLNGSNILNEIVTPADIWKKFSPAPKSILKASSASQDSVRHGFSTILKVDSQGTDTSSLQSSNAKNIALEAVSSTVLEKNVPGGSQTMLDQCSPASDVHPVRISRFKSSRLSSSSK